MPRVRDGGLGMTIKEEHKGDFCGDGIVLYLDYSGDYTSLHRIKWLRSIHKHGIKVKFLILILYSSYVKCNH